MTSKTVSVGFVDENPPRFETCGVCGDYAYPRRVDGIGQGYSWWNEPVISVPLEIAPQHIATRAPPNGRSVFTNCTELDNLCLGGYCSPELCALMTNIKEVCGCIGYHSNTTDSHFGVCGEYKSMQTLEDAVIDIPLELAPAQITSRVTTNSSSVSTTCTEIDNLCLAGNCSWKLKQLLLGERGLCGCPEPQKVTTYPTNITTSNTTIMPSAKPTTHPSNISTMKPKISPSTTPSVAPTVAACLLGFILVACVYFRGRSNHVNKRCNMDAEIELTEEFDLPNDDEQDSDRDPFDRDPFDRDPFDEEIAIAEHDADEDPNDEGVPVDIVVDAIIDDLNREAPTDQTAYATRVGLLDEEFPAVAEPVAELLGGEEQVAVEPLAVLADIITPASENDENDIQK